MASLFDATVLETVELSPGVTKEITKQGEAGAASPSTGEDCFVHYTGKTLDGKVFDSSVQRGKPFQFKVNLGMVISGWDKCVMSMKVGEKCVVSCDYVNAYGERGMPPVIPPKATLVFEVELLSIGAGASEGFCTVV
jgi:FKBP-type peptidyl-prolyl cis-trans isomerase